MSFKRYTENKSGNLIRTILDFSDVYDNSKVIETLNFGSLLITLEEIEEATDKWRWYGDKNHYARVITSSGQTGWIFRGNIEKVE